MILYLKKSQRKCLSKNKCGTIRDTAAGHLDPWGHNLYAVVFFFLKLLTLVPWLNGAKSLIYASLDSIFKILSLYKRLFRLVFAIERFATIAFYGRVPFCVIGRYMRGFSFVCSFYYRYLFLKAFLLRYIIFILLIYFYDL